MELELYPRQQTGTPFDDVDVSFLIFYVTSVWLRDARPALVSVVWQKEPHPEWAGICAYYAGSGVCKITIYGARTKVQQMTTLLHELCHVQQYHSSKLKTRNGHYYWKGEPVRMSKRTRKLLHNYRALPWEIEADELSKLLLQGLVNDRVLPVDILAQNSADNQLLPHP